ncbi:DUF916 and DUF3324 domain-containing protein [Listeria swaminathanii]|uniref:DUF916 and DUF3324 domain-containing protein n=1 Tax=Listeria swaminathanii TaxID=2713501 RepID=A0A7X0ZYL0_9LIST|nr:DUF916 and DUF3324 domain-containing protein [Listeria swaminathanii]MBC2328756.1 DUF916 and DUF3324 domain-containing protein [Listeria swaminathanii]MDT0015899.1 DUF916 and DUF3324 domain-containing protein [Listeria swaminathanii]MDT0021335.1 DUF916 and DUF3324 domain-containing protein [Listeria swaminathanii]MDT0032299.1 DUF916 and DUF3324 domain-containing protein [Listeria swaminathanii]MDT0051851.1 DUF916 and DUF3324 domain-containing protein [Listeria swaminathanii]
MKKSFLSLLFIVPLLVTCSNLTEAKAAEGDVGYSVQAKIPANQIDKRQTYFDLKMKPKQKQTVEIEVMNSSNEEIQVEASVNYASTNRTGVIDYTKNDLSKKDKSLKYPLPELAKISDDQKHLTIPVNGKKTVQVMIEMPEESIDGVVLGAVEFKKKNTTETKKAKGVSLKNEYSYIVGMQLSETDKQVKPHMNLLRIKPTLINYHTAVAATLQNNQPVIIKNLSIDAKVYQQNSDKMLYQTKKANMTMAPNSNFDFGIDWGNKPLKEGKYRLKMTATNGVETWNWDENFTIGKEGQDLNNEAVDLQQTNEWLYVAIAAGVLLVLLLIILVIRKRRKEQ